MQRTYELSIAVNEEDIDELEHVGNVAYVRWIQDIAVAHSAAVGLDFAAYRRLGAVFVVRRHEVDYLRPVLRGDRIEARTWIDTVMAAKCVRATELRRASDGELVATSRTTWGFVDVSSGRPTRIPAEVREAFGFSAARGSSDRDAPPGSKAIGEALGADPDVEVVKRDLSRAE